MRIRIALALTIPVAVMLLANPAGSQEMTSAEPPRPGCVGTFVAGADLEEQVGRATGDVRRCIRSRTIDARTGRRLLSALGGLRDQADYDRRRARGTLSARRERLYEQRLAYLMRPIGS